MTAAQAGIQPSTITNGDAADLLVPVKSDFGAARRDLGSPILLPVRLLPVLGRQLLAVRDMASAAERVATIGQTAVTRVQAALRAPHAAGPARLAAVQSLANAASTADAELSHISLGPHQALIGYVAGKHNEFVTKLTKIRAGIDRGATAAQAVAKMLAGPDRVLILAANNAEMRDGSGMFLSASSAEFSGGEVTVGSFQDTTLLQLPAGAVPLTGDLASLWGVWAPNREWRNLGLSPQFGVSAALAAQMWKAKTGQSVDAVMVLDVEAFRVLLDATGPVTSGGQVFDADNVVQYLLHDQYESVQSGAANFMRREQLSTIAGAVFANLRAGHYDPAQDRLAAGRAGLRPPRADVVGGSLPRAVVERGRGLRRPALRRPPRLDAKPWSQQARPVPHDEHPAHGRSRARPDAGDRRCHPPERHARR